MPSSYQRKPGSRRYIDYTKDELKECLAAIKSKVLTQRAAAEKYHISRSTIKNKLRGKHVNKPGRPTVFTEGEEKVFVANISCSDEDISLASSTEDHIVSDCASNDDMLLAPLARFEPLKSATEVREPVTKVVKVQKSEAAINPKEELKCSLVERNIVVGDYVLVTWNSRKYPGKVVSVCEEAVLVSCMKKGKSFWRWPAIKDEQLYNWVDINCKIAVPKFIQKGCFEIPELED